jgi:hypothetical protein
MNEKEILASSLSKAEKARQLFDLGKDRKEVAALVLGGNVGWAFNIQQAYNKKKLAQQAEPKPEEEKITAEKASGQEPEQQKASPPHLKVVSGNKQPAVTKTPAKASAPAKPKQVAKPTVIKKAPSGAKPKVAAKPKLKAKKGPRR